MWIQKQSLKFNQKDTYMFKSYINNFKEEDPEFTVEYGSSFLSTVNKKFIETNCHAIIHGDDYMLVSKRSYLIGVISYNKYSNAYYFFPSTSACNLAIINLIELTFLYLVNKEEKSKFSFISSDPLIQKQISFYFNNYINEYSLCVVDLKEDKLKQIKNKYDQVLWN
jgi:hypothetical protein